MSPRQPKQSGTHKAELQKSTSTMQNALQLVNNTAKPPTRQKEVALSSEVKISELLMKLKISSVVPVCRKRPFSNFIVAACCLREE
ncbi:hypothetical protein CDAR_255321 [Caerostris darwini]|uniref:Uncharacterized protein n=1 Tax=Caerostris darwini TaxID=1538125 RepID=A0AAV4V2M4_9ARAC|nr:hypothetical protein CDAR_255321 [Caerostris darwini]